MESGIKSSFIPHDTADAARAQQLRSGGLGNLLVLITIVLFIASVVLGVGVFLYQQYLEASSSSKKADIERAKAEFQPALILALTRLDDRMRVAETILGSHIAPSGFLHMLEQATLTSISFSSLDFKADDPQKITIEMDGIAETLNSVALQAQLFSKNGMINSPIFSGINREGGGVRFNFAASMKPDFIRYAQFMNGGGGAGQASTSTSSLSPAPSIPKSPFEASPGVQQE